MHIMFNLILLFNNQVNLVDVLDTMEECQQIRIWHENVYKGSSGICVPVYVTDT